jgi:hypothetical protein
MALTRYVFARDENGVFRSYGPGDDVPASVAKTITMPGVWVDEVAPEPKKRRTPKAKPAEGTVQDEPAAPSLAPQETVSPAGDGEE